MAMRALPAAFTLILIACGSTSPSPTAPSVTPSSSPTPTPQPVTAVTNWSVTQRFVSVEGPDNCWVRYQRGLWTGSMFPSLPAAITRVDGSLRVDSDWFQVDFAGTYVGPDFTATGVTPLNTGGARTCDGMFYQQMPGVSNLTGRFAADDQTFTALEVNSYRLTTGESVVYTWAWTATRLN
jgi:hypothetical protein